jgi:hypothetical protein
MRRLRHFDASESARSASGRPASRRRSQESGFAFLMALGLIFIALALSLVVLQNFATEGRRQREEETIWRGEQYERAVRLYYHKMGRYPQTVDDLKKGGLNLHFLRQVYKNPMNQKDGSWRFIYVNAAGQVIGSVRYATLQQMVLIDQYAGLIPNPTAGLGLPGQPGLGQPGLGVSAASLAGSSSGGAANAQQTQLKNVLAAILNPGDTGTDNDNGAQQLQSEQNASQPTAPPTGMGPGPIGMGPGPTGSDNQTPNPANGVLPSNGQLPAGISADQISQYVQNGQLPPGVTVDQVAQFIQTVQLPPGVTQQQVMQYVQNLQPAQAPLNTDSSQNPQNPAQPGQPGFGTTPGQPGFGSSSSPSGNLTFGTPSQDPLALNPLLQLKPTGAVEGPVLGAFFTGVGCTTDVKSVKYYRRGKKYKEWEFIWNPLEDALAAAQQPGGGQQGGLGVGLGQAATPAGGLGGNNFSNTFGSSSAGPGSIGGPQPAPQQPSQPQPGQPQAQ